ncbi:MAG: SusE domain-containing protein [Chitinophagaceae bacterium]|nr:SusE domain-containing protein [Chitinophagaceae bacterium]
MKNLIKFLFLTSLSAVFLIACKKEENKVFFEGGTAPVLTASTTADMVLDSTNAANRIGIVFNWTNPEYKFNTGPSSQSVTYILQVDTTGANFTNPNIQEVSISSDLRFTPSVKEFNGYLNKMGLQYDIPHNIEFRVKATVANGTVADLYSNVVKIKITPYLDVALPIPATGELYITGNAMPSDWTNNPPASQKCTRVSITEYTITVALTPGKYYKFLTNLTQWQPQYGLKIGSGGNADGGDMGLNNNTPQYSGDPDAIPTPGAAGTYKITLNFVTGKYKAVKQ